MDRAETQHGNRFLINLAFCIAGILKFDHVLFSRVKKEFWARKIVILE